MSDPFTDGVDANDRDYDPKPHERQCFTHYLSGDMGWLVRRDGKDVIKLDRPGIDEIRPYTPSEWISRKELLKAAPGQAAKVFFEADKALCLMLSIHDKAKIEWASLTPEKRRLWIEQGPPPNPPIRAELYAAMRRVLDPITGT